MYGFTTIAKMVKVLVESHPDPTTPPHSEFTKQINGWERKGRNKSNCFVLGN